MTSLWLNMIVRNEAHCMRRCLESVLAHVNLSGYVIADTGSTDTTCEIIWETLRDLPGEIHHDEWQDFKTNRNLVLERCGGLSDYIITLDADEVVYGDGMFAIDPTVDAYFVNSGSEDSQYPLRRIFRNGKYHYAGHRTHEVLLPILTPVKETAAKGLHYQHKGDGKRRLTGRKFVEDIIILQEHVRQDPQDARAVFYLAQSWCCAGDADKALEYYRQRVALGGFEEEVYYSLYQIAVLSAKQDGVHRSIGAFLTAWRYRPHRLEAIAELCRWLRGHEEWNLIDLLTAGVSSMPLRHEDLLFVDPQANWKLLEERGIAFYRLGRFGEAFQVFSDILTNFDMVEHHRAHLVTNLAFCYRPRVVAA